MLEREGRKGLLLQTITVSIRGGISVAESVRLDATQVIPVFAKLKSTLLSDDCPNRTAEVLNSNAKPPYGELPEPATATARSYPTDFLNRVVHGDALELLRCMPDGCVDLVVTDPPYGISYVPPSRKFGPIANDSRAAARALWTSAVPELKRVMRDDTFAFFSIGWTEMDWVLPLLRSHFAVKSCIVWFKNHFGLGYYTRPQHELNLLCSKGRPRRPRVPPSDVWEIAKVHSLRHSCEKPVALMRRVILTYSDHQAVVLDPFLGSGTTAVAARLLGRRFIGFELSTEFCALAERRIREEVLLGTSAEGHVTTTPI